MGVHFKQSYLKDPLWFAQEVLSLRITKKKIGEIIGFNPTTVSDTLNIKNHIPNVDIVRAIVEYFPINPKSAEFADQNEIARNLEILLTFLRSYYPANQFQNVMGIRKVQLENWAHKVCYPSFSQLNRCVRYSLNTHGGELKYLSEFWDLCIMIGITTDDIENQPTQIPKLHRAIAQYLAFSGNNAAQFGRDTGVNPQHVSYWTHNRGNTPNRDEFQQFVDWCHAHDTYKVMKHLPASRTINHYLTTENPIAVL